MKNEISTELALRRIRCLLFVFMICGLPAAGKAQNLSDDFNSLSSAWKPIYLQGTSGGSTSVSNGNLVLSCGPSTQFAAYNTTPLTGNFFAEINFNIDDAVGLALIKNNNGVPDPSNYTMLAITNRSGIVYANQYDKQNGIANVHDKNGVIPASVYETKLDGTVWSVPFVGTNKKIRILHEALSNSYHFYYGTTLNKDGFTSNDWLEVAPQYNWMLNTQSVFVALVVRNENTSGNKTVNFDYVKVIQTPQTDQDDTNTGFSAVQREYNWSGFNGNAVVVTFGNEFAFDKNIKFVFWDRANNAPMWRLDNQTMHSWEFGERKNGGFGGCAEAMSDRQRNGQELEIVENNAVRKVIRWKMYDYFPSYHYPGEGSGGSQLPYYEEYWTFYPDGTGTRRFVDVPKLDGSNWGAWPEFIEGMTIGGTTTDAGTNCASPAFSILNVEGNVNDFFPGTWNSNILSYNQLIMDAHYKNGLPDVFLVYNNNNAYPTGDNYPLEGEISWQSPGYNFSHWPVGRLPYGQNTTDYEIKSFQYGQNEVSSNALGSFGRYNSGQDWSSNYKVNAQGRKYREYIMLSGLISPNDYNTVRDYAQGWLNPGTISMLDGYSSYAYNNYSQRELVFTNNNGSGLCNFNFTPGSRWVKNPSFRIDNWGGGPAITVKVNGTSAAFKSAIVNGSLLVWVNTVISTTTKFEIAGSTSAPPNLALQKKVMVSSTEDGLNVATNAVDGNMTTRWSSQYTNTEWIYVDLGATYSINRVKINWEAAYGKDFKVQTSGDAISWATVKDVVGNTLLTNDFTGLSGIGRFVRIYGTNRATVYGYSIYELEVYGTPAVNLATNPGFESDGVATQTPAGWTEWNNTTASYTETKGPRSGSFNLAHWSSSAYSVSTYQVKTGLTNGTYTLKAWVKSSGGQTTAEMAAKNYDAAGSRVAVPIPATNTYTQITLTGINVTNGQCEISFYSVANAGNWINVDDVEFYAGTGGRETTTSGSEPSTSNEITLYPNPTSGKINIDLKRKIPLVKVHMYSNEGLKLYEDNFRDKELITVDTKNLNTSPGQYIIKIITNDKVIVRKIIIE